jgi:hypothetical protein
MMGGHLASRNAPRPQAGTQRYEAAGFWNALTQAADPSGVMAVPDSLRTIRYVGSPGPIVEDERLHGATFIRALLEELDQMDDIASREAGLDPLDWPEARQKSPENNPFIWKALISVCRRLEIGLPCALTPPDASIQNGARCPFGLRRPKRRFACPSPR